MKAQSGVNSPTWTQWPEFEAVCCEEEINHTNAVASQTLLKRADEFGKIPSRPEHLWVLIKIPFYELKQIGGLVCDIPKHLFSRLADVCTVDRVEHRGRKIGYCLLSFALIDPLHVLAAVITAVIRVVATVFGLLLPAISVKGWRFAAYIDRKVAELIVGIRHSIVPSSIPSEGPSIKLPTKGEEIKPYGAIPYLGNERAREIYGEMKWVSLENSTEKENLIRSACDSLNIAFRKAINLKFNETYAWPKEYKEMTVNDVDNLIKMDPNDKNNEKLRRVANKLSFISDMQHVFENYCKHFSEEEVGEEIENLQDFYDQLEQAHDDLSERYDFGRMNQVFPIPAPAADAQQQDSGNRSRAESDA